jgi:hypothetical protein
MNDFDNLILPNIIDNSTVTTVDDSRVPSEPSLMATSKDTRSSYDYTYSFYLFSDIRR